MKAFWKSKTFWANLIVAVLSLLQQTEVLELVSGDVLAGTAAGLNMLLRFVTKQPVVLR